MIDSLNDLARKVNDALDREQARADLADVREALNEAGLGTARRNLAAALSGLEAAQAAKREADRAEREAKEQHERAVVDAESLLVPPKATKGENGETLVDGREVVSWVAADKAAWRKREAARDDDVVAAAAVLRDCEQRSAEARDAVVVADKRFSACKADLDAAVATLKALAAALPARKAELR